MTRKDIIIIAVLANIGVLAILFMLAFRSEEEKEFEPSQTPQISYSLTEEAPIPREDLEFNVVRSDPTDEVDSALEDLNPIAASNRSYQDDDLSQYERQSKQDDQNGFEVEGPFKEITIKQGDALEKIARSNGTTVEAIKAANRLKTDRLRIGQVLKVPLGTKTVVNENRQVLPNGTPQLDGDFYTIKSGDNPWKIAKQFHLKLDELLKLNDLDEEKARNLKIGEQIRVR